MKSSVIPVPGMYSSWEICLVGNVAYTGVMSICDNVCSGRIISFDVYKFDR